MQDKIYEYEYITCLSPLSPIHLCLWAGVKLGYVIYFQREGEHIWSLEYFGEQSVTMSRLALTAHIGGKKCVKTVQKRNVNTKQEDIVVDESRSLYCVVKMYLFISGSLCSTNNLCSCTLYIQSSQSLPLRSL